MVMIFREWLFKKMLSRKCRKCTIGKKQVSIDYSFFLWGAIARQKLLDISVDQLTNNRCVYKDIEPSHPQPGCICSAKIEFCKRMITWDWKERDTELEVSWYTFGNKDMYHSFVQQISSMTIEESDLRQVIPLDYGSQPHEFLSGIQNLTIIQTRELSTKVNLYI